MSTETQRVDFEEWASVDTRIANIDRYEKTDLDDEGPYKNWDTVFAWSVWQAAQSSQAAEIEALKAKLSTYEAHGVTCQTFGHVVGACAECNTHDESKEAS